MSLVKELAEVVYVLHNGALLARGSVAAIQADPAVRAVYVGAKANASRLVFENVTGGYGSTTIVRDLTGASDCRRGVVRARPQRCRQVDADEASARLSAVLRVRLLTASRSTRSTHPRVSAPV